MNGVLLITITVTVALVNGNNSRPCQPRKKNGNTLKPYTDFVDKHILQWDFNRSSKTAWKRYLSRKKLCNRTPQTFMEPRDQANILSICNGYGRQLYRNSNLCISNNLIHVYQLDIGGGCKVERLETYPHYVIVACDKIGQDCLPVHYAPYRGEYPKANAPICRLLRSSRFSRHWIPGV